ncbi:molybdenum cofactor guanylyltransferase [Spongiibacter sp. IMCC21906]|uniref:molybdenum cofactor guanylyltransferase MobA n=1 Tax=Spongiibacter sp. IMCC21906 TaxID=1620392 RepID=UPI00062E024C|nr:molybdenum cofactor guanylyltransferase [Spongiibacter sp. IMCC21906]
MSVSTIHNTSLHSQPYSLLILAGGEGRRMSGQDKGLMPWHGKALVEHLIATLPKSYQQCLISCNRHLEDYRRYGETVTDGNLQYQGPLAGILAGMDQANTDLLLVLPCDCPQPPPQLFSRLLKSMEKTDKTICYAWDGQREQYLFALIKKSMRRSLQNYLDQGQRSVRHWYKQEAAIHVDFSDCHDSFKNFNTQKELLSK